MAGLLQSNLVCLAVVLLVFSCFCDAKSTYPDDLIHSDYENDKNRNKRSISSGLVDLAQFEDTSPPGKRHIVYVDDTMTRLIFQVTTYHETPVIMPTTPIGMPFAKYPNMTGDARVGDGKVVTTYDIPITSAADYGFWKFNKLSNDTWHVVVRGESPVSIAYELFEIGTHTPVSGYPIAGQYYKLVITTAGYTHIGSCDIAYLYSMTNISHISGAPLLDKGNGKYEAASVKMPSEVFVVGLQGKDNSNHAFRRIDTIQVVPVTVTLSVTPNTDVTIEEYQTMNITFTVTNLLKTTQDVDVRIEDTMNYTQSPTILSTSLNIGENFTGIFTLIAGPAGLTTSVRIVARQYLGNGLSSSGPAISMNVTVTLKSTTAVATNTSPHTTSSTTTAIVTYNLPAYIARFTDTSPAGKSHIFSVDATITRLVFEVTEENTKPVIMATNPMGIPYGSVPTVDGNRAVYDIPIASADHGVWKFNKLDAGIWDVRIQAESPVFITQQLYELGTSKPITGHPIPDNSYKLEITVNGASNMKSVNMAFLVLKMDMIGVGFAMLTKASVNKYVASNVTIPKEVFLVGIQGLDNDDHTFRRIDPTEITPYSLKLDVPDYTNATVHENEYFNITFTVTNLLSETQEIDVRISDDKHFAEDPTMLTETLPGGSNFSGLFLLRADIAGYSTSVKITAIPRLIGGKFGPGPEEIRNFTVVQFFTTSTVPTTTSVASSASNLATSPFMSMTRSSTLPPTTRSPAVTSTSSPMLSSIVASSLSVTPGPFVATQTPAKPNSVLSVDIDTHKTDCNKSPAPSNGQLVVPKGKDSLLLMFLTMSETEDKSIRINVQN